MIEEARLERVASGLVPVTPGGWSFGRPDLSEHVKPGAGFVLRVLRPGRPTGF